MPSPYVFVIQILLERCILILIMTKISSYEVSPHVNFKKKYKITT